MICPRCKDIEMRAYDGCLGYESIVCPHCNLDAKDDMATHWHNLYESEMRATIAELKNKLKKTRG